jgi:hypothetical protein
LRLKIDLIFYLYRQTDASFSDWDFYTWLITNDTFDNIRDLRATFLMQTCFARVGIVLAHNAAVLPAKLAKKAATTNARAHISE